MKQFLAGVLCAVVQFLVTGSVRAQFTANFQTITINGVTSNWAGFADYIVGSNTFGDVLLIENGGVLSNFDAIIGDLSGASNNTAIVTDPHSAWTNYQGLAVGSQGAGNNLVVSNGGAVVVGYPGAIAVGYSVAGSSNNSVTVTGTGSILTNNSDLYLGYRGRNNRMTISDGGVVRDSTGWVGTGVASSSNNVVTVTDPGSVWINGLMVHGDISIGNQITITNGGEVRCANIIMGNASSSSNNVGTVTGAGSVWNIGPSPGLGGLEVGHGGRHNQLTIRDGAVVHATHGALGGTSKSNVVTVTGTGSVWDRMVDLTVGSSGQTNTLIIETGGSVVATNVYVSYLVNAAGNRIDIEGGSLAATNVTVGNNQAANCAATGQITVDSGELIVTNAAHNAVLEVFSGTLTLNGGTTIVDRLVITAPQLLPY